MPRGIEKRTPRSIAQDWHRWHAGWVVIAVGFALQVVGVGLDSAYHLARPHGTAPLWAHLPIYAGAVVVLGGAIGEVRRRPSDVWRRLGLAGAIVEVSALVWSLAVRAEANAFFLPAVLGAAGGGLSFVALARAWWVEVRQVRARSVLPS
jgi:hypothetical protein